MKNIFRLILLFTSIVIISCKSADKSDCDNLRTGNFIFHSKDPQRTFFINRMDSLQIEVENEVADTSIWKVEWTNACEYKLTLLSNTYGMVMNPEKPISSNFLITAATKEYYIFRTEFDLLKEGTIDTIWKVN